MPAKEGRKNPSAWTVGAGRKRDGIGLCLCGCGCCFWPTGEQDWFEPEPGCSSPTFVGSAASVTVLTGIMVNTSANKISCARSIVVYRRPCVDLEGCAIQSIYCLLVAASSIARCGAGFLPRPKCCCAGGRASRPSGRQPDYQGCVPLRHIYRDARRRSAVPAMGAPGHDEACLPGR